jgi:hypothetical protein
MQLISCLPLPIALCVQPNIAHIAPQTLIQSTWIWEMSSLVQIGPYIYRSFSTHLLHSYFSFLFLAHLFFYRIYCLINIVSAINMPTSGLGEDRQLWSTFSPSVLSLYHRHLAHVVYSCQFKNMALNLIFYLSPLLSNSHVGFPPMLDLTGHNR